MRAAVIAAIAFATAALFGSRAVAAGPVHFPPVASHGGTAGVQLVQQGDEASRSAGNEARIAALEERVRALTGRIEELEFQQKQLRDRLDRQASGAGSAGEATGATPRELEAPPARTVQNEPLAPPEPPPPPAPPAPPRPGGGPTPTPRGDARQGYVLGTIPQGAVGGEVATPGQSEPGGAETGAGGGDSYETALALVQAKRYGEARAAFGDFIASKPKDPRAATAAYLVADTYYVEGDYAAAAAGFARNYKTYGPEAPLAPDNLLKLGVSLARQGQKDKACQTFAALAKRHPGAPTAVKQALVRERAADGCS